MVLSPGDPVRDTRRLKAALVATAALAFAVAPFFAAGFRGFEPQDFPVPQERPLVQPAGYAFAIWTLIYLWLLAHAGYGLFARADDAGWDAPRWPLFASLALGASWLAVADAAPVPATVQIWAMLALALMALFRAPPGQERWLLAMPLALYAGWLTAAAAVALGVVLGGYAILGEAAAAFLCLALAAGIGLFVQRRLPGMPLYGAGLVWALVGVVVADAGRAPAVALFAAMAATAVGLMALRGLR